MRRLRKAALALLALSVVLTGGWLVAFRPHKISWVPEAAQWSSDPSQNLAILAGQIHQPRRASAPLPAARPVYNYSVVRGGVHSLEELRQAVAHDHLVAAHYAGFKYENARIMRLKRAQLVYLSYRMHDKIFWTSKPRKIPAGEPVLTDGAITARTKCGNQISVKKQAAVSPDEPPLEALDQVAPPSLPPAEVHFPAQYHTALLTEPGPGSPPWVAPPTGPGPFPIVMPPLPVGGGEACETQAQENREHKLGIDQDNDSKENICPPTPRPPSTVPEPGTILLVSTGLVSVYVGYRRKKSAAHEHSC